MWDNYLEREPIPPKEKILSKIWEQLDAIQEAIKDFSEELKKTNENVAGLLQDMKRHTKNNPDSRMPNIVPRIGQLFVYLNIIIYYSQEHWQDHNQNFALDQTILQFVIPNFLPQLHLIMTQNLLILLLIVIIHLLIEMPVY